MASGAPSIGRHANTALFGRDITTPDDAAFTVGGASGDSLEIIMLTTMKQWSAIGTTHWFASQGEHVFSQDLAWAHSVHPSGRPRFAFTADGTTVAGGELDTSYPFTPGSTHWHRVVWIPAFGGVLNLTQYFISPPEDGRTWVQLGTNVNNGAVIVPRNSAQVIRVPGDFAEDGQSQVTHYFKATWSLSNVVSAVLEAPIGTLNPKSTSFRDGAGHVWTVNSPGLIGVV